MATVPVRFSATITDSEGLKASAAAHLLVDDGQTVAQVRAALNAYAAAVDGTTGGAVTSITAAIKPAPANTLKQNAALNSFVASTGGFDFPIIGTSYVWGYPIPALLNSLRVAGGINGEDPLVTALVDLIGASASPYLYTNPSGQALGAAVDSFLSSRKRDKLRERSRRILS